MKDGNQKMWTIFYSWQSDLPQEDNQKAIRNCLRDSSSRIEGEMDEITIYLDEATRDTPGSPDIPSTIFEKISVADIFICDLTTINSNIISDLRRTPNPNVLIELGYAVGILGWERIVMLFNKKHGSFPDDLPFDIDRRRMLDFEVNGKTDNNGKGALRTQLQTAISIIIEKRPLKPHEIKNLSPIEKKRNNDIVNLKWLLSTIHIPTMDYFIEEMPSRIFGRIFHFWEGFNGVTTNSLFYIYDHKAKNIANKVHELWGQTLSFSNRYRPSIKGDSYFFGESLDIPFDSEEQKDWEMLLQKKVELSNAFKEFLEFIRANYLEIDLNETSRIAFDEFVQFEKDFLNG